MWFEKIKEKGMLKILSGRWVFSIFFSFVMYPAHLYLSESFLAANKHAIYFLTTPIELTRTAEQTAAVQTIYYILSFLAVFIFGLVIYVSVLERLIEEDAKSERYEAAEIKSKIPEFPYDNTKLQLIIGLVHNKLDIMPVKEPWYLFAPKESMFQNFLITGTIGTGKTASVMYPFLKQAIFYEAQNIENKAGMLILDVKGNFYERVLTYIKECGRENDLILIKLNGEHTYNPLHKPTMEAIDLASRSRQVMDLFSGGAKKDKFWDTKAGFMMTASISLLRMTKGYVTLGDIHNVVTDKAFLEELIMKLQETDENFSEFDVDNCLRFFEGEFASDATNMIESIKACVTEMTGFFASSERINKTFCPKKDDLTFTGFEQMINEGKVVVLAMNVAEYPEASKTIAAYLKLDFQSEVQQRTSKDRNLNNTRPVFFISDEYQEFVTVNDAKFYGLSRESKCCNIVSSQSYNSLLQTLGSNEAFDTLQQNLINKIWLRSDDKKTVDTAQFLTGKEEKEKYSKNISESINDAKKSKVFGRLSADKASISESINVSTQKDFVFDEKVFTQGLELFKAVCFTANAKGMNEPTVVHLLPYFEPPISDIVIETKSKKYLIKMSSQEEKKNIETQ